MKAAMGMTLAGLLLAGAARAEVTDKSAAGFEAVEKATIAAPPAKVWAVLQTPGAWWSSQHSWSGDAKNLTLDLSSGCFCEKLPNGHVRHMEVVFTDAGKTLRLFGALGPMLMTGSTGHLAFELKPNGAGTDLTVTFDGGGYVKGGIESLAAPVDRVLGEQTSRLKRYLETGKPDPG